MLSLKVPGENGFHVFLLASDGNPWCPLACRHVASHGVHAVSLCLYVCILFFFFFFFFFGVLPRALGLSWAGGGATAASLCHSHSHRGSELHLPPTPQLTATPDP